MNELEIETFINKNKTLFKSFSVREIETKLSTITLHNIDNIVLNLNYFPNLRKYNTNKQSFTILIAIYDITNKLIEHRQYNKEFIIKNNRININIKNINNSEALINYNIKIAILNIEKANELMEEITYFYHHNYFINPNIFKKIDYKTISFISFITSIIYALLIHNIYNTLVKDYGFIDNLINIFTISNVIIYYISDLLFNPYYFFSVIVFFLYWQLFEYINCFVIYIRYILIKIYYKFLICGNKSEVYYESKINAYNIFRYFKQFAKITFSLELLLKFLIAFTTSFIGIASFLIYFFDSLNVGTRDYRLEIVERYFNTSKYPKIAIIKDEINQETKKVVIIGYDYSRTYYYDYSYIEEILNKDNSSIDDIAFSKIYANKLKNINKDKLKDIENYKYYIK